MCTWLKQSTSATIKFGPGLDKTDGVTPETGLATAMDNASTGIRLSKNGGNYADRNDSTVPAHDESGDYDIVLDDTDTDTLGTLRVMYEESATCLPIWADFMVVTANAWDTFFGADTLNADLTQIGGDTQSATDLKDFADAGYDPATNKVQGVVLVDTTTTNTDMLTAAAVNTECDTALTDIGLDHMVSASVIGADITDNSIIAKLVSKEATADWDDFVNTTDSLQSIRDELVVVDTVVDGIQTDLSNGTDGLGAIKGDTAATLVDTGTAGVKLNATQPSGWAANLAASAGVIVKATATGTPTTTTMAATGLSEDTDDHYNGRVIIWTSGVLIDQATEITDYTGSTNLFTFTAVTEVASATDTFIVI